MIRTDLEAVTAYPQDAHWYNKLSLSQRLGYRCGTGIIPYTGTWIVRPITNLDGMGRSAVIDYFKAGTPIDPKLFYCEVFEGRHITIDYVRKNGCWTQTHTFEGFNTPENLVQFTRWLKVNYSYPFPDFLENVASDVINIEVKGGRLIEVHLRGNPDPVMYQEFCPIWSNSQTAPSDNYIRIIDQDDETDVGRLGFFVLEKY